MHATSFDEPRGVVLGPLSLRLPSAADIPLSRASFYHDLTLRGYPPIDHRIVHRHLFRMVPGIFGKAFLWLELHKILFSWAILASLSGAFFVGHTFLLSVCAVVALCLAGWTNWRSSDNSFAVCWKRLAFIPSSASERIRLSYWSSLGEEIDRTFLEYKEDPVVVFSRPRVTGLGVIGRILFGRQIAYVDGWDTGVPEIDNHHLK